MDNILQGDNSITYNEETMKAILTWWLNNNQFGKAVGRTLEVIDVEQSRHEVNDASELFAVELAEIMAGEDAPKRGRSKKSTTRQGALKQTEVKKFYKVTFRPQEKTK